MKRNYFLWTLTCLAIFSFVNAEKFHTEATTNSLNQASAGMSKNGFCQPSTSQAELNINNVRARLLGGGDFWWDGVSNAQYQFPKVDAASNAIPINSIFAGALWFTAVDDGGNLKVAAQTYRNQGHDFWTGPLEINGGIDRETCADFDRHFEVLGEEITEFIGVFQANNEAIGVSEIPQNVLYWPGKGNPHFLTAPNPALQSLYYNDGPLAPFFDYDNDGIYDPTKGDYPVITADCDDPTFADQMIFWVINDRGNVHGRTGGEEMGVQVNCLAFAYSTSDALNNMTFYTFEIVKRTQGALFETYMGLFVDPDLGEFQDDYVGCDTARSIGFVYNANAVDAQYGGAPNLPIMAIDYFEGPLADDGSELGLSSFFYFNNAAAGCNTDPDVAAEFRNYHLGLNRCGAPWFRGGNGVAGCGVTAEPAQYIYTGNPALENEWSEVSPEAGGNSCPPIAPADRRFLQNSGPFTLLPGQFQKITVGVIGVFPETYDGRPDIEKEIGPANDLAQNLFDNCFQLTDGPDAPTLKIRELENELVINLVNQPGSNNVGEAYQDLVPGGSFYQDSAYLFQGYKVYQLKNASVSAQDLDNPAVSRLIYQVDIKDTISEVFNYFENETGFFNSQLMVSGSNEGIVRSFRVTRDAFAEGDDRLINNNRYFFAAVAYAYNNFVPFEIPLPPIFQTTPYLQGRRNFRIYSAIPHAIDSRNGGTELNSEFGQPLKVERVEGQGNGGLSVRLAQATLDAILENPLNKEDILEYELGSDPLRARVIDPLFVQNADFELRFKSFVNGIDTNIIGDSTVWEIYVSKDGVLVDTIFSDRPIDRQYDQIIEDYGISVNIGVVEPALTNLENNENVYRPISSSIIFSDLANQWLSTVSSSGLQTPTNWIRSGSFADESTSAQRFLYDDHQYRNLTPNNNPLRDEFYDPNELFATLVGGGFAPYCLASNYGNPNPTQVQGPAGVEFIPDYLHGPAFRWDIYDVPAANEVLNPKNTLDKLSSIQLVITPDKSKWSKCIVFETGENSVLTQGNARKGMLRQSDSKRIDGTNEFGEVGRSWFPGYAVNVETGERLNVSFGESSDLGFNNGNDMIWNPTDKLEDGITEIIGTSAKVPTWGGKHFIYVWETLYDEGQEAFNILTENHNLPANASQSIPDTVANLYDKIMYTGIPILPEGTSLELDATGQVIIPSEVTISINIEQPFDTYETAESFGVNNNKTLPRYRFSTVGLAPSENVTSVAEEALNNIRVVPNPYYAFSAYEESQFDRAVKITNLPSRCIVSIYSLDGKLVRRYDRAIGSNIGESSETRKEISDGNIVGQGSNLDNSLVWDLNNQQRIPVGSGTYIIHIDAPGIGEQVVKSVVFLRPTDLSNF